MRRALILTLTLMILTPSAYAAKSATRADFIAALWESAGAVPFDANPPFTDVAPTDGYAPAIGWACGEGIVYGVGDNHFAPARAITREETAVLLRRYAERLGRSTFLPNGVAECNDFEDISPWSDDSLYWACDVGLLPWSAEGRLDPEGTFTAEDISQLILFFVRGQI